MDAAAKQVFKKDQAMRLRMTAWVGLGLVAAGAAWAEPETVTLGVRPAHAVNAVSGADVRVPLELPGESLVTLHTAVSNWVTFAELRVALALPVDAPAGLQVLVNVVDWDGFWHQTLLPTLLVSGVTNRMSVDVSTDALGWEPLGHHGAWHRRSLMEPREVGLRVFGKVAYTGACDVVSAAGVRSSDRAAPAIRHVRANDAAPAVHGPYELRFEIPDRYANPFDPREVAVDADIRLPSGESVSVPGFYYQGFFRTVSASGETILPQGRPEWRLRYSPREEGEHRVTLRVRDAFGEGTWGPARFVAGPANGHGMVRVSKADPRFFEYTDGSPYFPIGHNIRSPFDTRMDDQFPWRFRHPEGSSAYRRYFKDMQAAGANLVEVWASAWCMGLEWSPTQLGYHGIGQYNLVHAWELDHVFRLASEHGLNVNLVLNNHGRLSDFCDPEWKDNPFNVACGGFLSEPMTWFDDPRALREYEQQMRYLIARYAWNPHLYAWELWSELNLAGSTGNDKPHQDPRVIAWHRRIGQFAATNDFNRHMVSTHVSNDYRMQNPELISVPELSLAAVDAYHGSRDPLEIVRLQVATAEFNNPFGKPVLVTEFGGSPMAADLGHLRREVHAALWSSVSTAVAGTPLFWWWQVIEEEDFYPMYKAVSQYMAGEDRRDPELRAVPVMLVDESGNWVSTDVVGGTLLSSPRQSFGWLFANFPRFISLDPKGEADIRGLRLRLAGTEGAIYRIEFWDTLAGTVVSRLDVRVRGGIAELAVPPFARDIAFKAKRQDVPAAVPEGTVQ
jgi:hypothetical protein